MQELSFQELVTEVWYSEGTLSWWLREAEMELVIRHNLFFTLCPKFFPLVHGCTSGALRKCSQLSCWLDLLPTEGRLLSNNVYSIYLQTGPLLLTHWFSISGILTEIHLHINKGQGSVYTVNFGVSKPESESSFLLPICMILGK